MNENIRIRRLANAPGNNYTIPKSESDRIIKAYDKSLFDKTKWIRFKMTGEGQGTEGVFGFCIENFIINFYYVEQHSFQTPTNKNTQYRTVFLSCEVDENGNAISKVELKQGTDEFPFTIMNALKSRYDINENISLTMGWKTIQLTKENAEIELNKLLKKQNKSI